MSDMLELVKYYLAIKVSLNAVRNICENRNIYIIRIIPYFDPKYVYEA